MKLKVFITLVVAFISILSSYGQEIEYEKVNSDGSHFVFTNYFMTHNNKDELLNCCLVYYAKTKYPQIGMYGVGIELSLYTKDLISIKKEESSLIITLCDGSIIGLKSFNNETGEYDNELNSYRIASSFFTTHEQINKMILYGVKKVEFNAHPRNCVFEFKRDEISINLLLRFLYAYKHITSQYIN